ncbi:hypothetical protein [Microbacterium sp.]|uniref:hypothetical protein n=1 Tax=Microbacterium sp. TaxID=51671 RepID=UPI0039E3C4A3
MSTTPRTVIATAAVLALGLAGCTTSPDGGGSSGSDVAAFVACLKAGGLEAQVGEQGHALVRQAWLQLQGTPGEVQQQEFQIDSSGAGANALWSMVDDAGVFWVAAEHAAYFADDPDTEDAYAACEATHPDFTQPAYSPQDDPELHAQLAEQQEDGIAFARCARDAGFAWVADPEPNSGGAIVLPLDLTEDEFRALLTACGKDELSGIGWSVDTPTGELDAFDWFGVLDEYTQTTTD